MIEKNSYGGRGSVQAGKEKLGKKRPWSIAGVCLGGVLVAILLIFCFDSAINAGKIRYGVTANGLNLGGKTVTEATKYLDGQLNESSMNSVKVTYEKHIWKVSSKDIGLDFDEKQIAVNAYDVGRTGSILKRMGESLGSYIGKQDTALISSVNTEKSVKLYEKIQAETDVSPVDYGVKLENGRFVVTDGHAGTALNTDRLVNKLSVAMIQNTRTLVAPVDVAAPVEDESVAVTKAEAQDAADVASSLVKTEITVFYNKKSWKLKSDGIAQLFDFKRNDDLKETDAYVNETLLKSDATGEVYLVPFISTDLVGKHVLPLMGTAVGRAAVDAGFSTAGGRASIIPAKNGTGANPAKLSKDIIAALQSSKTPKVVSVTTHAVEPSITTKKAQTMGIENRISTYTTSFNPGNKPRVANIQLLARSIAGTLLAPGKTFSFNGTIGERTAEKGYKEAGAIVNGEVVPQLGGGICQVNTTLFNAVLLSGLPITQRRNHSYYISEYPVGRDATVSWGGPDLKFVNNLDTWVFISSAYTNSSVTISIYGTDLGYSVNLSTSDWSNIKDYPINEIKDEKLKTGTKIIERTGIKGGTVVLTRTVSDGTKQVLKDTFTSHYAAKPQVVRVGTKVIDLIAN
ncbi:MAG: VanW family protein [Coriobacteriia bacterium]|nr:VanW family protein [Coriobacteriia bacterium]